MKGWESLIGLKRKHTCHRIPHKAGREDDPFFSVPAPRDPISGIEKDIEKRKTWKQVSESFHKFPKVSVFFLIKET